MKKNLSIIFTIFFVILFANVNTTKAEQNIMWEGDALDQVNYERSLRGLRPYKRDVNLGIAARGCCRYRCKNFIEGHYDDFSFLPLHCRTTYSSMYMNEKPAGCGVVERNNARPLNIFDKNGRQGYYSGWESCCTYENWEYAGAYYAVGQDGKKYCHIFVR